MDRGCSYHDGWIYALRHLSGSDPIGGRFARRRASSKSPNQALGGEANLTRSWTAQVPSGLSVRLERVHPNDDGSWTILLDTRLDDQTREVSMAAPAGGDVSPRRRIFGGHLLRLRVNPERDALGCPAVWLTVELPSAQAVEAQPGQPVVVLRDGSATLGDLRVRYRGWVEAITVEGTHLPFVDLEITRGGRTEHRQCPVGESISVAGHTIEALAGNPDEARLRLRSE